MKLFLLFIIGVAIYYPAHGADIAGRDDAQLKRAVLLWLQNDDARSLNSLSELAGKGNVAARLLLARIERTERAPSKYLENLSAVERKQLFRGPAKSSRFFPSWLRVEADRGNRLAGLLQKAGLPEVDLQTIKQLKLKGENQATDHLVRIASLYGSAEVHRELLDGLAIPQLHPYVISQQRKAEKIADGIAALRHIQSTFSNNRLRLNINDENTKSAAQFLALGTPFGSVDRDNPWRPVLENWIFSDAATRAIALVCSEKCPAEKVECGIGIVGLTGGYYEVIRQDSPLESVIPQQVFITSPRAKAQALRRAALTRAEYGGELATLEQISSQSQCLADLVDAERDSRYYK